MQSCFPPLGILGGGGGEGGWGGQPEDEDGDGPYGGGGARRRRKRGPAKKAGTAPDDQHLQVSAHPVPAASSSPPSSQSSILHDLDLFYIRQIAHSLQETELERKVELELKMREASAKLLAASRTKVQSLEAAKSLLVSGERVAAYVAELQRRRRETPTSGHRGSLGRLSISELRFPLAWKDSDHFKNKGDHRRFAAFCLVRVGAEVQDTGLAAPADRSLTDLAWPDVLVFQHVPPTFRLRLELYAHVLSDDLRLASTPRRICHSLHSSLSKAVGKRLAADLASAEAAGLGGGGGGMSGAPLPRHFPGGPEFRLAASAELVLSDAQDAVGTHDLTLEPVEEIQSRHRIPLFGHFCCRLAAQPDCISGPAATGPLFLLSLAGLSVHGGGGGGGGGSTETVGSSSSSSAASGRSDLSAEPLWAVLQGFRLGLWDSKEAWDSSEEPFLAVPVDRNTTIVEAEGSPCELSIGQKALSSSGQTWTQLRTSTPEECEEWASLLRMHSHDHAEWGGAARHVMAIPSPASACQIALSSTRRSRHGSLYDQTPLGNGCEEDVLDMSIQSDSVWGDPSYLEEGGVELRAPASRVRSRSVGGSSRSRAMLSRSALVKSMGP